VEGSKETRVGGKKLTPSNQKTQGKKWGIRGKLEKKLSEESDKGAQTFQGRVISTLKPLEGTSLGTKNQVAALTKMEQAQKMI